MGRQGLPSPSPDEASFAQCSDANDSSLQDFSAHFQSATNATNDGCTDLAVYKSVTNDTEEEGMGDSKAPHDEDDPRTCFGGYIDTSGSKSRSWNCNIPLLFVISGLALIIVAVSSGIAAARDSSTANETISLDNDISTATPTLQPTLRPTVLSAITTTFPTTRDSTAIATNRAHVQRTYRNITADGFGDADKLQLSMKQISFGAHTFFGYIGQSLTIPWSADDRYIIALESTFHDHLPLAHEAARIILIDTWNGYITEYVDETRAWNLQQGTMLYWNPHTPNSQFFFNDRDPQTNQVFTVLFDITTKSRVKEYRFDDGFSVANGGVCPEGGFFFALNYARMARLRPVTGYAGAYDWTVDSMRPADDGIWKVDITTGQKHLIISYEEIFSHFDEKKDFPVADADLYINHSLCSRQCTKIYFFLRGRYDGKEQAVNQAFVANSDGTELRRVSYIGGHPEWVNESLLFGKNRRNIVYHNISSDETEAVLGKFDDPRGDLALSTGNSMFVNGWEEEDKLFFHVVRLTDGAQVKSMPLDRGPYSNGELRVDAAPRWNRKGTELLVPGWVGQHRQLHVISVHDDEQMREADIIE